MLRTRTARITGRSGSAARFTLFVLALFVAATVACSSSSPTGPSLGMGGPPSAPRTATVPLSTPLTTEQLDMLSGALQDEFHAEAVYNAVLADFGEVLPFANVVRAEQNHAASLAQLFSSRALTPPASLWTTANVPHFRSVAEACAAAAGAEVALDLAGNLPPVIGGPVRLQQVIVNVLTNAADAVEGRADRRIHLSATCTDHEVIVAIRDHGPGVAPGIADRIFDPFFTTKQVGSGLGLGLSISYNIMKDFEGDLRVANHPQGGAIFSLILRRATAGALAAE